MARWINGMDAAQACTEEKTILCGHWHCSYGHATYEHKGSEFGPDADFRPYVYLENSFATLHISQIAGMSDMV